MSDVKMLLEMVETVDPANIAKLDEIDARVWCEFFAVDHGTSPKRQGGMRFIGIQNGMAVGGVDGGGFHEVIFSKHLTEIWYTRSRDALKSIRPKGWHYECNSVHGGTFWAALHFQYATGGDDYDAITKQAWYLKTEELAELHAVIQAISHDRGEL